MLQELFHFQNDGSEFKLKKNKTPALVKQDLPVGRMQLRIYTVPCDLDPRGNVWTKFKQTGGNFISCF